MNRVNDQVRKRQKRISNLAGEGEEHSIIWGMFMAVTINAGTFMGKEFPSQSEFHYEYNRSHTEENVRHTCKIGERVGTIHCEKHSWKYLSLIGDETINNLQRAKVCVFSDSVLSWKGPLISEVQRIFEIQDRMFQLLKATETMTESVESRLNSSGTSSQDSPRCSSMVKSQIY